MRTSTMRSAHKSSSSLKSLSHAGTGDVPLLPATASRKAAPRDPARSGPLRTLWETEVRVRADGARQSRQSAPLWIPELLYIGDPMRMNRNHLVSHVRNSTGCSQMPPHCRTTWRPTSKDTITSSSPTSGWTCSGHGQSNRNTNHRHLCVSTTEDDAIAGRCCVATATKGTASSIDARVGTGQHCSR